MLNRFLILSLSLVFTPSSWASTSTLVPFYRTPQSQFASGQASRNNLEDTLLRSELEVQYQVEWNKKDYTLKAEEIVRDIQVAKDVITRSSVQVLSDKKSSASILETLPTATSLQILESDEYWAQVVNPKTKVKGFLPLHLLQTKNEDRGYAMNLIDTYLRKSANQESAVITTIPRLTKLNIIAFEKSWIKVRYDDQIGYADINHFVSRADYAKLAFHSREQWVKVLYREDGYIVTDKNKKLPLSEIWGFVTNPAKAVMLSNEGMPARPPLRARVEILQPHAHIWGVSRLDGHGEVWWKKNNLMLEEQVVGTDDEITTDQLMKRKLYSVAFASKNSLRGIVSAGGIYRTDDGIKWKKVPQFNDQNLPVSIHPDGIWFVGSYKSVDGGHSFDPFIRWDLLAQAIENAVHRSPKILKITKIESLANSQVQILVDTGLQSLKLRSNLQTEQWAVVR